MTVSRFIDTNILLYAAMGKEAHETKRHRANELIFEGPFGVSGQVLAEFYTNATRKSAQPLTPLEALEWIKLLALQTCVPVDQLLVIRGIAIATRYGIDYWDGAIVAAAEALGADILYTEDFSHGQIYGTVRAVNPFV